MSLVKQLAITNQLINQPTIYNDHSCHHLLFALDGTPLVKPILCHPVPPRATFGIGADRTSCSDSHRPNSSWRRPSSTPSLTMGIYESLSFWSVPKEWRVAMCCRDSESWTPPNNQKQPTITKQQLLNPTSAKAFTNNNYQKYAIQCQQLLNHDHQLCTINHTASIIISHYHEHSRTVSAYWPPWHTYKPLSF